MNRHNLVHLSVASLLGLAAGCVSSPPPGGSAGGSGGAAIVGQLAGDAAAKLRSVAQGAGCPEVVVTLNGAAVTVTFDDDCAFVITDVEPADLLELRVELPDLGVAGTVEIVEVSDGELIEVVVEAADDSLSVAVLRQVEAEPAGALPEVITGNNTSLLIAGGVYEQDLTVLGNKFTLVGEAGEDCDDDGWSVITGDVQINGNAAVFRNIAFEGDVEVRGNAARFIHCCFAGELVVFGNAVKVEGD